ncbi:virion-associated protein [Agrobacterium phage Milano]|nr:virion-associated protein [Agrobacterium phage Milano]
MAIIISQAIALSLVDAIHARIDAGAAAGHLRVYSGARPANPEAAVPGASVLLVDFELNDPAFLAATMVGSVASANADTVDPVNGAANGTATWFRISDSNGVAIFDGSVTDQTGTGDLKLATTTIVAGVPVTVVSLTGRMSTGA